MRKLLAFGFTIMVGAILSVTAAFALEEAVKEACEADIAAYCVAVADDDDALKSCLDQNKEVVSAQCRQALDES